MALGKYVSERILLQINNKNQVQASYYTAFCSLGNDKTGNRTQKTAENSMSP
jgi:hypothetical protein